MSRLLYGFLYFGVLALLIVATVVVFVEARPWAVVPALLAIGWVSPLTDVIVERIPKANGSRGRGPQGDDLWSPTTAGTTTGGERSSTPEEGPARRQPLIWIAVALMLTGAVLFVADVGAAGLWIAAITVGIALVATDGYRRRHRQHHT